MHHANLPMNAKITQLLMPPLLTRHRSPGNRVFIQLRWALNRVGSGAKRVKLDLCMLAGASLRGGEL
jgi:hypothetical protein